MMYVCVPLLMKIHYYMVLDSLQEILSVIVTYAFTALFLYQSSKVKCKKSVCNFNMHATYRIVLLVVVCLGAKFLIHNVSNNVVF